MINLRPGQGNRTRSVEDQAIRVAMAPPDGLRAASGPIAEENDPLAWYAEPVAA